MAEIVQPPGHDVVAHARSIALTGANRQVVAQPPAELLDALPHDTVATGAFGRE